MSRGFSGNRENFKVEFGSVPASFLVQHLHEAGLAAGSVVLVDDALLGRLVQGADSLTHGCLGLFGLTLLGDELAGFFDVGTSRRAKNAIALSLLLRASDPFQSRSGIGQLFPPYSETSEGMIHYFGGFVQSDAMAS
jgi:hypothetical protein